MSLTASHTGLYVPDLQAGKCYRPATGEFPDQFTALAGRKARHVGSAVQHVGHHPHHGRVPTQRFWLEDHYTHVSPEEPRLGPDGSVFVQTLGCGLERITGIDTSAPRSQLVFGFPGNWCGVPTIVRQWPHGWNGAATPHGAVFSR
jgi:hypothetical protein